MQQVKQAWSESKLFDKNNNISNLAGKELENFHLKHKVNGFQMCMDSNIGNHW